MTLAAAFMLKENRMADFNNNLVTASVASGHIKSSAEKTTVAFNSLYFLRTYRGG